MQNELYGRMTTLMKLKKDRDDVNLHPFNRLQADQAIEKIKKQLKDKPLMAMREQLIKATQAGDLTAVWKIENRIRAYEGKYKDIEDEQ